MTSSVLLLDYDHTLYPHTLNTLVELDRRITLFIQTRLGISEEQADRMRIALSQSYGTTLRGLQLLHRVDPHEYCEFIEEVSHDFLPPPNPRLCEWLQKVSLPLYLFTNGRRQWAERGFRTLGLGGLSLSGSPRSGSLARVENLEACGLFLDYFDIAFLEWIGKPHDTAYARVEQNLAKIHGSQARIIFADDRVDNLLAAKARNWTTIWVRNPCHIEPENRPFDFVVDSLADLDHELLA